MSTRTRFHAVPRTPAILCMHGAIAAAALLASGPSVAAQFSLTAEYSAVSGLSLPLPSKLGQPNTPIPAVSGASASQLGGALPGGGPCHGRDSQGRDLVHGGGTTGSWSRSCRSSRSARAWSPMARPPRRHCAVLERSDRRASRIAREPPPIRTARRPPSRRAPSPRGRLFGIVKYTPGPNRFGGTFRLLTGGTTGIVQRGSSLPSTVTTSMGGMTPALPFSAIRSIGVSDNLFPFGAGYASMFRLVDVCRPESERIRSPISRRRWACSRRGRKSRRRLLPARRRSASSAGFPLTTGKVYVLRRSTDEPEQVHFHRLRQAHTPW